jgi:hypothetical protein
MSIRPKRRCHVFLSPIPDFRRGATCLSTYHHEAAIPESEDQAVTVTDANAPFDNPDADVIIRSSDNVDFRVLKLFLSWASPFFGDMFGLPQGPAGSISEEQETRDGIPVIQVTEKSQVMETLLKFCHPNHAPAFKTVEEILPVMEAAIKYGIEGMERHAREALTIPPLVQENQSYSGFRSRESAWVGKRGENRSLAHSPPATFGTLVCFATRNNIGRGPLSASAVLLGLFESRQRSNDKQNFVNV